MDRRCALGLAALLLAGIPFGSGILAQGASLRDQLVGTWVYVSSTAKREDGNSVQRPDLQGAVTYNADGRFHFITTRTDAPKYASNDTARPSPEEAMAVASGSIAYTGTYTVDEPSRTIHLTIETSTFPNLVAAPNQRRIVTSITADEMTFMNPRTPAGVTLEFAWEAGQVIGRVLARKSKAARLQLTQDPGRTSGRFRTQSILPLGKKKPCREAGLLGLLQSIAWRG